MSVEEGAKTSVRDGPRNVRLLLRQLELVEVGEVTGKVAEVSLEGSGRNDWRRKGRRGGG